ncbi:MAG: hypothetical protein JJE01_16230 [Gemmatimonadetes bacterium]|nr:hypothetical protein [Gemmatimonadota bacterium]
MRLPDRPYEERVQMAMEAALERSGPDRDEFVRWLSAADPKLAATVILRLSEQQDAAPRAGD